MNRNPRRPITPSMQAAFDRELKDIIAKPTFDRKTLMDWLVIGSLSVIAVCFVFGLFYLQEDVLPRPPLQVVKHAPRPADQSEGVLFLTPVPDGPLPDDLPALNAPGAPPPPAK